MSRSRMPAMFVAAGAACALVAATPVAASAHGREQRGRHHGPVVRVLDTTVLAPFQLATRKGSLYVADGGVQTVFRLGRSGLTPLATGPAGGDVAGVALNRRGDLAYTATDFAAGSATLTVKRRSGSTMTVDLSGYEATKNPDRRVRYGIDHPTPCQKAAFEELAKQGGPPGASYRGQVDAHPYAVAALPDGSWIVADAGGNDLLKVDRRGRISTVAVLPRQPAPITAAWAKSLKLPDCVVGAVYNFEPVPTDVEVDRHGSLVVSLLPGGAEDASLGARGAVYRVNPGSGRAHRVAGGFLGATNVALDDRGRIFVAELFAGQVSVIDHGRAKPYVKLPGALSLVWSDGILYAGTLAPMDAQGKPSGKGSLVAIR